MSLCMAKTNKNHITDKSYKVEGEGVNSQFANFDAIDKSFFLALSMW